MSFHLELVYLSGFFEILLGFMLLFNKYRTIAAKGKDLVDNSVNNLRLCLDKDDKYIKYTNIIVIEKQIGPNASARVVEGTIKGYFLGRYGDSCPNLMTVPPVYKGKYLNSPVKGPKLKKWCVDIEYHPKPIKGDWNGSGMHANFSNSVLREAGSKEVYDKICEAFAPVIKEHMAVYGAYNEERLTGKHETAAHDEFSYGVSDRGASIRIPIATVENDWKGWLEDRRPASNGDPYKIAGRIIKTVKSADV